MSWLDAAHAWPALVMAVASGGPGVLAPRWIARLPEPEIEAADGEDAEQADEEGAARGIAAAGAKEPYADIAALPHLGLWLGLSSAVVGAAFGAALGWTGALVYLAPLVPIGAMLLLIDWRTTLLPTRIIHPTYALLGLLVPLAALLDRDPHRLLLAGAGWLVIGGWFWVFWWVLGAWGFGDVRLARVLGPALGYLGWAPIVVGLGAMVLVGGLGGVVMAMVNRSLRRRYPYGPFMLVGAAIAVLCAPQVAAGLGY